MGTMAKKPFFANKKIGFYKFIGSPGYAIKIMTVGFEGVFIGECDNNFNLIYINDYDKQELVLSVLFDWKMKSYKSSGDKVNPKMLTSRFKITKRLNIDFDC